jgi:hypothetical protein
MELRFPSVPATSPSKPVDPRPAPRKGLDGDSGDLLSSGVPAPAPAEKRSPRRRPPGGDRERPPQEASPAGHRELSTGDLLASPAPVPTDNPFLAAIAQSKGNILQVIGSRFVEARALQKAEAWRQLQTDLMMAAQFLCPTIIPLKDLLAAAREIEDFVKGSTGQVGRSNEELMEEFLNGGGKLGSSTLLQPPEGLDKDSISEIIEDADNPPTEVLTTPADEVTAPKDPEEVAPTQ